MKQYYIYGEVDPCRVELAALKNAFWLRLMTVKKAEVLAGEKEREREKEKEKERERERKRIFHSYIYIY